MSQFDPKDRVAPPSNVHQLRSGILVPGAGKEEKPVSDNKVLQLQANEIATQKDIIRVLMQNLKFISMKVLESAEEKKPEALEEAYQAARQFREDMKWVKGHKV